LHFNLSSLGFVFTDFILAWAVLVAACLVSASGVQAELVLPPENQVKQLFFLEIRQNSE
jgi:hypothetical protein